MDFSVDMLIPSRVYWIYQIALQYLQTSQPTQKPKNQYLPDLQFNVQVSGISPLHGDPQLHLIAIFLFPFFETTFQGT